MIFLFNCDTTRVRTYLLVNSLPTNVTRLIKSIESVGTGKLDQVLILEPSPSAIFRYAYFSKQRLPLQGSYGWYCFSGSFFIIAVS